MRRSLVLLLTALFVAGVIGACSEDSGDTGGAAPAQEAPAADEGVANNLTGGGAGSGAGGGASYLEESEPMPAGISANDSDALAVPATSTRVGRSLLRAPGVGPSVIKTADVEVEVDRGDFQSALNQSITLAGRYGGFIVSTTVDDARKRSGSIVMRIPARHFENALSSLEGLGELQSEIVSGKDVSQEFIDLDARIRNYEAQEAVLIRLMDDATSIDETIRVQHELQSIRLGIERLEGRLRYLKNQAAMSTISMRLIEAGVVAKEPAKIGILARALDTAVAGALAVVAAVIIGAGVAFPIALMVVIVIFVLRIVRLRLSSAG